MTARGNRYPTDIAVSTAEFCVMQNTLPSLNVCKEDALIKRAQANPIYRQYPC